MNRFIKLVTAMLLLGAVATASTVGGEEVSIKDITTVSDSGGNHCDAIERILGLCKSSEDILTEQ